MNGCIDIFFAKFFTKQDSIFVVITFPRHERYKNIEAKSQFTTISSRTIGQYLTFYNMVTTVNDWFLVKACGLVRTKEFIQTVCINTTIAIAKNVDFITPATYDFTRFSCQYTNTGVCSGCIFHTCTN